MDMNDSFYSFGSALNEQIAKEAFDLLPEGGPVMVIMDTDRNCLPSDPEQFSKLNIDESFLAELCSKIDDGVEPVVTQANDSSIVSTQLVANNTNCGYIFIILCQYSPESTLVNIDIIEILLGQINLIAKLIEENHTLSELQKKHNTQCLNGQAILN